MSQFIRSWNFFDERVIGFRRFSANANANERTMRAPSLFERLTGADS